MPDVAELGIKVTLVDGEAVAQRLTAIGQTGEAAQQRIGAATGPVTAAVAQQAEEIRKLQQQLTTLSQITSGWKDAGEQARGIATGIAAALNEEGRMANATAAQMRQLSDATAITSGEVKQFVDSTRQATLTQMRAIEMNAAMGASYRQITDSTRQLTLAQVRGIEMNEALAASSGSVTRAMALQEIEAYKLDAAMGKANSGAFGLSGALTALAGAIAVGAMVEWDKATLNLAARYQTIGVAMTVVGGNAGYTAGQMGAFQQALERTGISMLESRNNLAKMAAAQLDLTKAAALGRVAQDAAVIGNINSSEAFERLVQGIVSGQSRVLHTMGIFAAFGQEERKWAEDHDRTTASLSQAEKVQIRLNGVLEEGEKRAGAYEAAMGTVGKELRSTERYLENVRVKAGTAFLPEYAAVVKQYADMLKYLGDNASLVTGTMVGLAGAVGGLGIALAALKADAFLGILAGLASSPVLVSVAAIGTLSVVLGAAAADAALARRETAEFAETLKHIGDTALTRNIAQTSAQIAQLQQSMLVPGPVTESMGKAAAEISRLIALRSQYQAQLNANANAPVKPVTEAIVDDKAMNRAADQAGVKLEALIDTVRRLREEANNFGKEGSIDSRLSGIGTQLDNLALKAPSLSGRIDALRKDLLAAGDAMRTAADNKLSTQLDEAYRSQKQLSDGLRDGTGALGELSAAKQAQNKIDSDARALGRDLSAVQQQRVRDTFAMAAADKEYNTTKSIHDQADAVQVENTALANGTATRKDYVANLDAEIASRKASSTLFGVDLALRLAEIERLREAKVARIDLTTAITEHDKAVKQASEDAKRFDAEQQRIALTIQRDLLSAVNSFTASGLTSFKSFFGEVERMSSRMIEQMGKELASLAKQLETARTAGDGASVGKITAEIERLQKIQQVAQVAQVGVGAAMSGYSIGQSMYSDARSGGQNEAAGALGGAAAGAAAGAVAGPWGAAAGAIIGLTAGIIGAGRAADEAAKRMADLQKALTTNIESMRATIAGDSLGVAIAQAKANFDTLRKQTEDAYAGGGANSDQVKKRNDVLADLNKLEAQRITQLQAEFAATQVTLQEDARVRTLRAQGSTAAADALAFELGQARELAALKKQNATNETIAAVTLAQAIEAVKRAADLALQSSRGMEDLNVRILNATGQTRAGADAAFRNQQQREYEDAKAAGKSDTYLSLLGSAQKAETIQRAVAQEILDQTALIQAAAAAEQARMDAQIAAAQDSLKLNQQQLQVAQQSAAELRRTADSLTAFQASLTLSNLSTLSPVQRLAESKKQLDDLFAAAKGGDAKAGAAFGQSANTFLGESKSYNASSTAYGADFASVQAMTAQLQGKFSTQATAAEQTVALLQKANDALQAQIAALQDAKARAAADAQAAIAALNGVAAQQAKTVDSINAQTAASLKPSNDLLGALAAIAKTTDLASKAQIDANAQVLRDNNAALVKAAADQVAAIKAGATAADLAKLDLIRTLEAQRLDMNTQSIAQQAALQKQAAAQLVQIEIDRNTGGVTGLQLQQEIDAYQQMKKQIDLIEAARKQADDNATSTIRAIGGTTGAVNALGSRLSIPTNAGPSDGRPSIPLDPPTLSLTVGTAVSNAIGPVVAELRIGNDSRDANIAVLQAGFSTLAARIDSLSTAVDNSTTATRRGFEQAATL